MPRLTEGHLECVRQPRLSKASRLSTAPVFERPSHVIYESIESHWVTLSHSHVTVIESDFRVPSHVTMLSRMATCRSSELQWFAPWNSSRCPSAESRRYQLLPQFLEPHQWSCPATETSDPCTHPSSQAKDGLKNFSTDILPDFTTSWAWRNMSSAGYYQNFKWGVDCVTQKHESWRAIGNSFVSLSDWFIFKASHGEVSTLPRYYLKARLDIFFYQLVLKIYCKDVFTTFSKCLYPDHFTLNM